MIKEIKSNQTQIEIWRSPVNLEKFKRPRGEVHVIVERCKECNYCTYYCPNEVLERSPYTNSHGYHYVQVKAGKENSCVNCGMCQTICPDFAIFVKEVQY